MFGRLSVAVLVLIICTVSLLSTMKISTRSLAGSEVNFQFSVRLYSYSACIWCLISVSIALVATVVMLFYDSVDKLRN